MDSGCRASLSTCPNLHTLWLRPSLENDMGSLYGCAISRAIFRLPTSESAFPQPLKHLSIVLPTNPSTDFVPSHIKLWTWDRINANLRERCRGIETLEFLHVIDDEEVVEAFVHALPGERETLLVREDVEEIIREELDPEFLGMLRFGVTNTEMWFY